MTKIKIVTETILKIKKSDEKEMRVKAYSWQKKVADFLDLVQKTLVQDVEFKNTKITSIKFEKK
tara:strand:- start:165 stop:356 length:192 start_codon:yes stop_codon:yes gene_type:complete